MSMTYGGPGLTYIFRLKIVSGAYTIVQIDGTTAATTLAHASMVLSGYTEQTAINPQADGSMKIVLDNYDATNPVILGLNALAKLPNAGGGTAPAGVAMEHGTTRGGSAATSIPDVLYIPYGGVEPIDTPLKRLMHLGVGNLDMSSGSITLNNGSWVKPAVLINGKKAEYELTVPEELFDGDYLKLGVGGIGDQVIPQYSPYERNYLLKAV